MYILGRVFLFVSFVTLSGSLTAGWMRNYGGDKSDAGLSVEQTSDGGYIVAGTTESLDDPQGDIWLLRFNDNGDTLWTKVYGDTGVDEGYCVKETPDGGYILATSLALIKTDDKGAIQWTKPYPGKYVDLTRDGGYVAVSDGNKLVKLNSKGDTLWTKIMPSGLLNCVRQTSDGGYILAGHYEESGLMSNSWLIWYAWFLKTDSLGNILWDKAFDGDACTEMYSACELLDGGYVFGGNHQLDAASVPHLLLVKTDSSGEDLWFYSGYKDNIEGDPVMCVFPTNDGGFVTTNLDWHTIRKYDSQGKNKWSRIYGYLVGESIQQTKDGGYIVTGYSYGKNLFLLKTEANGDTLGITEPPPVTQPSSEIEITSPVGSEIVLCYSNWPNGFRAIVYDASGRKVDELLLPQSEGIIQWGERQNAGVYFIRSVSSTVSTTQRVVLLK